LKGLFASGTDEPVSYVNAPQLAEERGLEVRESQTSTSRDYVSLVSLRSSRHSIGGTLVGAAAAPRIVMVDGHVLEVPPASHMLLVHNDDRPGVIGRVGTALGDAGVSISNMAVGQILGDGAAGEAGEPAGTAMMILSTDRVTPTEVLEALRAAPGLIELHSVSVPV
jgi:D-3-phosphoglycerate dehydrogenase